MCSSICVPVFNALASSLSLCSSVRLFSVIVGNQMNRKNEALQIVTSTNLIECILMITSIIGNVYLAFNSGGDEITTFDSWLGSVAINCWMCLTFQRLTLALNRFLTITHLNNISFLDSRLLHIAILVAPWFMLITLTGLCFDPNFDDSFILSRKFLVWQYDHDSFIRRFEKITSISFSLDSFIIYCIIIAVLVRVR
uniref:7TM_GPCR_Srx domain-containing protein n=1 Tax=Steinernema glaseri TaxID=37863 RepID=A0A1I8ASM0_9BILA